MEFNKQQNDARQVHELYWKSYITGDINTLASLLDEHYTQVGSVEGEVFHNKKDAVRFIEETIDQINGKVDMRNRITKLDKVDNLILVSERCDLYALIDNTWTFYAKFRASTLLHEKNGKWLIIHQHSSMPDTRAEEGENIALDKIAAENLQLKEAVKRRTIELEHQNRELEIEAALERVRARTMAMHHSSELADTATILFQQIKELGFEIWSCGFGIWRPEVDLEEAWMSTGDSFPIIMVPFREDPTHLNIYEASQRGESVFEVEVKGEVLTRHYDWLMSQPSFKIVFGQIENSGIILPTVQYKYAAFFKQGYLHLITTKPQPDIHNINQRFAKVFEQTYTRFLDLQKAEAQARESQIQLALERVRARTMAMQHSSELSETSALLFQQIQLLGVPPWSCGFNIWEQGDTVFTSYMGSPDGTILDGFKIPLTEEATFIHFQESRDRGDKLFIDVLEGKTLEEHYQYFLTLPGIKEAFEKRAQEGDQRPAFQINHLANFSHGNLMFITYEPCPEAHDIFIRFAKVFEQTYTRFLDLQKAEVQAREAQIEAALEKVRGRTMAMQSSDELADAAYVLFEQLNFLGVTHERINIGIVNEDNHTIDFWVTEQGGDKLSTKFSGRISEPTTLSKAYDSWKKGEKSLVVDLIGEELKSWLHYLNEEIKIPFNKTYLHSRRVQTAGFFSKGMLILTSPEPLKEEALYLLEKFASVFDLTYTRFNDLKIAEAQAREALIEAALERVRSRTMAMQRSEELPEVAGLLFQQVKALGVPQFHCGFNIFEVDDKECTWYPGSADGHILPPCKIPLTEHPVFMNFIESRKRGDELCVYEKEGEYQAGHYRYMLSLPVLGEILQNMLDAGIPFPTFQIDHLANFSHGNLLFITSEHFPEMHDTFKRFAKVFEQTYTRFLDLQKAEAQAREAQIEVSLERVRARAMAMQRSDELKELIGTVFTEMTRLDIALTRTIIMTNDPETRDSMWWMANQEAPDQPMGFFVPYHELTPYRAYMKAWEEKEVKFLYVLEGHDKIDWDDHIFSKTGLAEMPDFVIAGMRAPDRVYLHASFNNFGNLTLASLEPLPEEHFDILLRFAKVFDLTYTRFNDLRIAEIQTHKAKIETALERVRARALAMQAPEELIEVSEVLRYEMGLLGVEELETCSIYLHNGSGADTECWYAIKDTRMSEKRLVSDHFTLDLNATWVGREMLKFFDSDDSKTSVVMKGRERKEWINYCEERSSVLKGYYGTDIPDRTYHMYKFSQGAIGAAAAGEISAESWGLLQRAAAAFSLAYSRFRDLTQARHDLQNLKEEKQRAEAALKELKAAQTQLIQAEKMASLGELTAGIAHEIQNPLNFVNNFSEVNIELAEEIIDTIEKGDFVEAKELAADIRTNQEKIREHGKRADGIVKSMLQHSRTSTGQKELRDLAMLADEYLRLSYHGMRAKEKSFNSDFELISDPELPMVNIIPQEIGRVILNLINNAFYAVNEKKKIAGDDYKPKVTVTLSKDPGSGIRNPESVQISISDNGTGIPDKLKEKIFQPFFTTKPTGEGTGLGLSLSYDIITKAHGGTISVETTEQSGTRFIVQLPVSGS